MLDDLRELVTGGVHKSDTLVLLATKGVLLRPWCLIELLEAERKVSGVTRAHALVPPCPALSLQRHSLIPTRSLRRTRSNPLAPTHSLQPARFDPLAPTCTRSDLPAPTRVEAALYRCRPSPSWLLV
jgi:hypothetical protein|eukprot:3473311-Prymnesium_polylepis.1